MKKITVKLDTLTKCAQVLGYKVSEMPAIATLKDGSRMTAHLSTFETEDGILLLNISDSATYQFDNKEEYSAFIAKKFETFENDKELWMTFAGMTEETYEEWNKV